LGKYPISYYVYLLFCLNVCLLSIYLLIFCLNVNKMQRSIFIYYYIMKMQCIGKKVGHQQQKKLIVGKKLFKKNCNKQKKSFF
jgi:hypothetical protein